MSNCLLLCSWRTAVSIHHVQAMHKRRCHSEKGVHSPADATGTLFSRRPRLCITGRHRCRCSSSVAGLWVDEGGWCGIHGLHGRDLVTSRTGDLSLLFNQPAHVKVFIFELLQYKELMFAVAMVIYTAQPLHITASEAGQTGECEPGMMLIMMITWLPE